MNSNRLVLVDREYCHSSIEGVSFGGRCWILARSPAAVLIWVNGHSWSVNGHQSYSGPQMILLPERAGSSGGWLKYITVVRDRRLSRAVIDGVSSVLLDPVFGEDVKESLKKVLGSPRQTLLIEGGGRPLMPDRNLGEAAYVRWRDLPESERGFYDPVFRQERDKRSFGYEKISGGQ